MTLKTRNRTILIFLVLAVFTMMIQGLIFLYSFINETITFDKIYDSTNQGFFPFIKQDLYVILGIFFQFLMVIIDCYALYRSFVKTQAQEVSFFLIFLLSLLVDTFRIWIPCFNLSNSFSAMYIFCGNACLFSNILAPLALLFMTIIPFTDEKQNYDKLSIALLFISLFLATVTPLNTTNTLPNFSVGYSFRNLFIFFSVVCYLIALIAHFFNTKAKLFKQYTTIGLALLILGIHLLKNSLNLSLLILALGCCAAGSVLFLKELHNQYLWTD